MGNQETKIDTYSILKYGRDLLPESYHNFILSKWLRSYRYGNDYIKLCDSDSYFAAYSLYARRILGSFNTTVRLAVLSDEPDVALGFSISRDNILDYVYVHKDQRKLGIGKNLVPPGIDTFTHLTKTAMKLWPTKMPHAKFNPFA